jgi:hypothetical protein
MPYRDGRWRNVHGPHHRIEHKSHSHTCGCGKLAYRSKTEAKRAMREAQIRYAGESGHWGTYSCLTDPDAFHYGHLPRSVVRGHISRGEVYRDE